MPALPPGARCPAPRSLLSPPSPFPFPRRAAVTTLATLAALVVLTGCQTLPDPAADASPAKPGANAPRAADPKARSPGSQARAARNAPAAPVRAPDETIRIAPGDTALSPEMDARLDRVLARARGNDQVRVRLEAYSPDRGSNAWEIAMAEQSLQVVRSRVIAQGIRPYRIEATMVGDRDGTDGARDRNGVRLYLIDPSIPTP